MFGKNRNRVDQLRKHIRTSLSVDAKKILVITFIVLSASIFTTQSAFAQQNGDLVNLSYLQQQTLFKLENNSSNLDVGWRATTQMPSFIRIKNLNITWQSDNSIQRAYQFIDEYKDLFQIKEPVQELQFVQQSTDDLGMQHVTLQQMHQGVPVYASRLVFHFKASGDITSINGMYLPNLSNTNSTAQITKNDAVTIAKNNVKEQLVQSEVFFDELNLKEASSRLVYYNHGLFSKKNEETYLTWRVSVYSETRALNQLFYIDATNGEVINQLDNLPSAQARETYVFADCLDYTGTLTYDETGLVATYDDQAETVHEYASLIYDYYFTNFGRDSYDSLGSVLQSYTHYEVWDSELWIPGCAEVTNAFWDPERNIMFYGEDFLSLDVASHETTHGVIQYSVGTTDEDTLEYENESGALNESYADIFGELTEFYYGSGDWLLGTDLPSGPSRDMTNPNNSSSWQPSNIQEMYELGFGELPDCDPLSLTYNDCGYIHSNSGITNNALYLLVNGGTNPYSGDGVTTGIGREAAEQIYYRALTTYLDTASDFTDAYQATMQACLDLNASDSTTYPISYCESVYDAFAAVGINTDTSYAWADIAPSATTGTAPTTITFDGTASTAINSTITDYAWDFGDGSSDSGSSVSHTFSSSGTYTVTLTITDSNGYTNTATEDIVVYATGTISSNTTWSVEYSPYVISGGVTVSSGYTLTIEPEVVVKFASTSSYLNIAGTLDAQGTATDAIVFTSYYDDDYGGDTNNDGTATTPAAGDWRQISFAAGSVATLEYVTIHYGGTASSYSMLKVSSDSVTVTNSILLDSAHHVIEVVSVSPSISNSTLSLSASSRYGLYINGGSPTIDSNTISSNGYGVYVTNSAAPTLSNNIITENSVSGISIIDSSGTVEQNTITNNYYGIGVSGNASPTLDSNTIDTNDTYGISTDSTGTPIITNNTVNNSSSSAININDITTSTTVTGNTGSGNSNNGITLSGNTDAALVLDMTDNDLPYLPCSLTINSGASLTIPAGSVVKMCTLGSRQYLTVSGTFDAQGTATDPIIITSYYDDTYGGDTNEDGSATSPASGDWTDIVFSSSSIATLEYVTIQYGSTGSGYPMIQIRSNSVTVNNSNFLESGYYNLYIAGDPTISNTTIMNITATYYGAYVYSGSPNFESNTISNYYYGLHARNGATPNVTNNLITSNTSYGIYLNGASGTYEGNTISDNPYGLYLYGSSTTPTLTGNSITGNTYGIQVSNSANPTLSDNLIDDNSSYGLRNYSTTTITAENNWWGDASGPYNATSNPTGTGDTVSDYVDFDPWTTTDPTADTTPPSDVTLGTTWKNVWNQTITLRWTNPTDSDFDHVQIDQINVTAGTTTTLSSSETGTSYIDTTPAYNITYTYTLYACDTSGNCSTGVTTSNQRLRNPTPTGLTLTAGDTTITATWTASSAPARTLEGYMVYYGTSRTTLTNVIDVGNVTSTTLTGLTNGTRYFVAVTAYNTSGTESPTSQIRATRPHP